MGLTGEHTKVVKWIEGNLCVLRVEVDAIIPADDPSEPCLEPQIVRYLDRLQKLADEGCVGELEKYGDVFVRRTA